MLKIFKTSLRVKYADTDKMGVVYYGRYFEYFEAARNELLREIDYVYTRLEQEGLMLPVVQTNATYLLPAYYDDKLDIHAWIEKMENVRIKIAYKVYREQKMQLLVKGSTTHVFISRHSRKIQRPPRAFVKKIQAIVALP